MPAKPTDPTKGYWVYIDDGEEYGVYVLARSAGHARILGTREMGDVDFVDVRVRRETRIDGMTAAQVAAWREANDGE